MDLTHDRTSVIEEKDEKNQDKNSNFPDHLIQHILTFLDMKYVVQTSKLSHKWEHFWKATDYLNLNCCEFRTQSLFSKFVKHVLLNRRNDIELSKISLTFKGSTSPTVVKSIVNYAYQQHVTELKMTCIARKIFQFPECIFNSPTLKNLTLSTNDQSFCLHKASCIPKLVWDFPALETVFLSNMHFGDKGDVSVDLFSKCVNLRDLTLHKCCMSGLKIFHIRAPELSNLTITDFTSFPDVFNVIALKLENVTASVKATVDKCSLRFESLQLTTEGFDSLEKVNLSLSMPHYDQKRFFPLILDLFHKLRSTKFLVINLDIIETLSLCLDQLSHEPRPFDKLKCLKIKKAARKQNGHVATVPTQVLNYFLENSPSATFIMDLPQVPRKRPMQQVDDETMAKKVAAKLVKKEPETVAQEKRMLDANLRHPSANIHIQPDANIAELPPSPRQSSSIVPQKRSMQQVEDETIAKKVAKLKTEKKEPETVAQEMRMLETNIRHPSANIRIQPDVNTAELPSSPRQSSSIFQMPTFSRFA